MPFQVKPPLPLITPENVAVPPVFDRNNDVVDAALSVMLFR